MKLSYLEQALAASRKGTPAAIATNLVSGQQSLVLGSETSGNLPVDDVVRDGLAKALAEDRSTTIEKIGRAHV